METIKNSREVWVVYGVQENNQVDWLDELVGKKFAILFDTKENAATYHFCAYAQNPIIKGRLTFEQLPEPEES